MKSGYLVKSGVRGLQYFGFLRRGLFRRVKSLHAKLRYAGQGTIGSCLPSLTRGSCLPSRKRRRAPQHLVEVESLSYQLWAIGGVL